MPTPGIAAAASAGTSEIAPGAAASRASSADQPRGRCAAAARARSPEWRAARSTGIRWAWSGRRRAPRSRRGPIAGVPDDRTRRPRRAETAIRCRWRRKNTRRETRPAATRPPATRRRSALRARADTRTRARRKTRRARPASPPGRTRPCCRQSSSATTRIVSGSAGKNTMFCWNSGPAAALKLYPVVAIPRYQLASQRRGRFINSLSNTRSGLHVGLRRVADDEDGEIADEEDHRARADNGGGRGAKRRRAHPARDGRRQMPVDRLLAREDMAHAAQSPPPTRAGDTARSS